MRVGRLLPVALGVLVSPSLGDTDTLTGAVRVGPSAYAVVLETAHVSAGGSLEIKMAVSQGDQPVTRAFLLLSPQTSTLTVDGRRYSVPEDVAARWRAQLERPERTLRQMGAKPAPKDHQRLTFQEVEPLTPGLIGKSDFLVDSRGLRQLRVFGLEEWNNSFRDYFSLGLSREEIKESKP